MSPAALVTVSVKVVGAEMAAVGYAGPLWTAPMPGVTTPVPCEKVGVRVVLPPTGTVLAAAVSEAAMGAGTAVSVVVAVTLPPALVAVRV